MIPPSPGHPPAPRPVSIAVAPMFSSLSVLSSSAFWPHCGRAYRLPRCPPSPCPLLSSARPSALKPSSSRLPLLGFSSGSLPGFAVSAASDGGTKPENSSAADNEAAAARGQSTLPDRFRHLTKEVPDRPVRWPWLIALVFLVYAWQAVLWELSNWKKAALAAVHFSGYLSKLLLALVFRFVGPPVTALVWCIDFVFNFAQSLYSGVVAFTPVSELLWIIILTSVVVAIAVATDPDAVSNQHSLLTVAGLLGYGAVGGAIPELLFWSVLIGMFCYSRFIKKQDGVSAALPSVAVMVAIGEPWVRGLMMASYLGLGIVQHSKPLEGEAKAITVADVRIRPPVPLVLAGLAIGIHLAAKWVRYRHLTWMIV